MEICSKCGRNVRSSKGWHYCAKVELEDLFAGKQQVVSDLFDALLLEVIDWENVAFSATKNCIVFTHNKTFLVVKPMQKALNIKFYLPHFSETPPISKCQEWSGKYATEVRLTDLDDLTSVVFSWIKTSYKLL
jgi:predicted transport protein